MKIIKCEQGTPEWWAAKRGIPSASNFARIMTPKTMKIASAAQAFIAELIADIHALTLPMGNGYQSEAMALGKQTEEEARRWYEMEINADVQRVGFIMTDDGRFGASPDALVGEDGGLELKCPTGKVHVEYLLEETLPDEYKPQVHGCLIVSGRPFWDFLSYAPGLPPLRIRVEPDAYTKVLRSCLEEFWGMFQEKLDAIRRMK